MGPTWGPRWAPCWPHEVCYQGADPWETMHSETWITWPIYSMRYFKCLAFDEYGCLLIQIAPNFAFYDLFDNQSALAGGGSGDERNSTYNLFYWRIKMYLGLNLVKNSWLYHIQFNIIWICLSHICLENMLYTYCGYSGQGNILCWVLMAICVKLRQGITEGRSWIDPTNFRWGNLIFTFLIVMSFQQNETVGLG